MNKKVKTSNGVIALTDKHFLAAGGEGSIYVNGGKAFKIYHDSHKALSIQKIKELSVITDPHVITPKDIIYDVSTGEVLGYVTDFIDGVDPLLKFFTRTFKQDNNLSNSDILDLIKKMHLITSSIHSLNILIVDYNELNILVKNNGGLNPYYIDTDSYQTPSFKSHAVMNSIMDRKCARHVHGNLLYDPTIYSDWFSFGVLSFWTLTGIHPYRARHPKYKPNQCAQQMDDNISVFDPQSKLPPSVSSFSSVIPNRLLGWYMDVFKNGNRSIPPLPDGTLPVVVPTNIVIVKGNADVEVNEFCYYSDNIINVNEIMGIKYVTTKKHIYSDQKELVEYTNRPNKMLISSATDGTVIVSTLCGNTVTFSELIRKINIGSISANGMFLRNGLIYTIGTNGKLIENGFTTLGTKVIHRLKELENISVLSSKIYEGCVIQNLLGNYYLTLPYDKGMSFSKHITQLSGYRVIDAKCDRNVCVILAEKAGKYDKFVLVFAKDYSGYDVRVVKDVSVNNINFTVTEKGLCLLINEDGDLELFFTNNNIQVIKNPPIDISMKLISFGSEVLFINGNSLFSIKKK